MIFISIEKMTIDQLQYRIDLHESTADVFEQKGYSRSAREFRQLAAGYRFEIQRRNGAVRIEAGQEKPKAAVVMEKGAVA